MKVYKIYDPETNQFSTGGTWGWSNRGGKIWTIGTLKQHLAIRMYNERVEIHEFVLLAAGKCPANRQDLENFLEDAEEVTQESLHKRIDEDHDLLRASGFGYLLEE